jgi:hypothetical protein
LSRAVLPTLPDLYARALELASPERERFVAEIDAAHPPLAAELRRLLAVDGGPGVLDRSPWRSAAEAVTADRVLERLGPYRIERELGRGGMGRVFLAEQQGADFTRQVALKVVNPGGAGPEVERRFREERRILASLEHPGIARFYDAGRSEDGTWFLALEYVEGEDFLSFLRRRRLGLRSRIELFLQVLDAVDFAHRRLVVHRDLKPGNVLVDGEGRAKLLDFGISRILDTEDTEEPATRTELRALTPAYASPEQVRGERVTIASDVYSLGVMFYEILAGRRPAPAAAPMGTEPLPPSRALRSSGDAADHDPTAGPVRWRELQGDLDAIALKALRSGPESRYRSAAAFADDLRRWLSGQAVEARRGGRRYRVAKFVARHRVALAAAAAVVLALAGGLSLAMVQRSRALAAQAQAEATVADLHRLSQAMLFEIYDQVRVLPGSLGVSGTIVRRATEVLDRLSATAGDDPRLLRDLAVGYEQLGAMFGTHPAIGRSLNRPRAAVEVLAQAVELRGRVAARADASFADRLAAAESHGTLARAQARAGDRRGAESSAREGIERLERLEAVAPDRPYLRYRLAVAHTRASREAGTMATEDPESDPHFVAAARLWREFAMAPPSAALDEERFVGEVAPASLVLIRAHHAEEALRITELGLAAFERRPTPGLDPAARGARRAKLLVTRADTLERLGRHAEALTDVREIAALQAALEPDPDDLLADAIGRMSNSQKAAELAVAVGDLDSAIRYLAEAEGVLASSEQRYGAPAFASVRMELERTRGDVWVRKAQQASLPGERDRLLSLALASYRTALAGVDALGGAAALHGSPPDRIDELRRLARSLEERVQGR